MQADIEFDTVQTPEVEKQPILILTTQGRYSGKSESAMLIYRRLNNNFVVVASNADNKFKPDWFLNLKEEPIVNLEIGDAKFYAKATTPTGRARVQLLPIAREIMKTNSERVPRETSVVVLSPMC